MKRRAWASPRNSVSFRHSSRKRPFRLSTKPFGKVGKSQVAVEVSSVIRASPSSFRVAWIERRHQDGSLSNAERWSAILTVAVRRPRDADTLRKNPLGIYINAINWLKGLGS